MDSEKMTVHGAHEVIPSAKRLMKSLRNIGYDFSSAVADIVDNSIEAGATSININVSFEGDESWVSIEDNGRGMDSNQIIEALRYGSERDYNEDDLGKFGLGLKTSSFSQCKFFVVASRKDPRRIKINAYYWDLSHIERTNRWQILPLKDRYWMSVVSKPLQKNTGTVVLWRRLDRILGYKHPYGEAANKQLMKMCSELERHLAMVFHRFLSGEIPSRKKIEISLNGNKIKPWDPFARNETKTQVIPPVRLIIEHEGTRGEILLEPYILPHQQDFSTLDKFRLAAGPTGWNQQQGFYIYRADRLIQSGGWCRLRTSDEHTKLARIALSFPPTLDEAFKINVAKMRVQLPSAYRETIGDVIQPIVKTARETYDRKQRATSHPSSRAAAPVQVPEIPRQPAAGGGTAEQQMWTLDEIEEKIITLAKSYEKQLIKKIFNRLRKKLGVDKKT